MCIPVPCYIGFSLFGSWLKLSVMEKINSLIGTSKSSVMRRWTKPLKPIIGSKRLLDAEKAKTSNE
jgi:hypothetical protein